MTGVAGQEIATVAELRQLAGDIDDVTVASILSLEPSIEEVELAIACTEGRSDARGNGSWPLTGKAAEIFEILVADAEQESLH